MIIIHLLYSKLQSLQRLFNLDLMLSPDIECTFDNLPNRCNLIHKLLINILHRYQWSSLKMNGRMSMFL